MAFNVYLPALSAFVVTLLLLIASVSLLRRIVPSSPASSAKKKAPLGPADGFRVPDQLSRKLAAALPDSVIFPRDTEVFEESMMSYWAQQECEVVPACIVRPQDILELCTTVTLLKQEYDERSKQASSGEVFSLFAVRSGGHSPVSGAASIEGGVLINLHHFREVTPSENGTSVVIGAGAKWMDVSTILDKHGLAVVGGRNSAVGVGGLTLGGGLSFFSPQYGLVCSNVLSYELVLASGTVTTASATINSDLWQALKGGSNNFGIVTRFTVRSFVSTNIWSGLLYMPSFQTSKVLSAFHEFVNRGVTDDLSIAYDSHAAGPIVCFSYIWDAGLKTIAVNLVHTKPIETGNKWPACWRTSSFPSLWRLWSTCRVRTLTSATDETNALNPPGRRQVFATTTIKNDLSTLAATHAAYNDAIASLRRAKVKGLVWTLVLQPLLPVWARKGDPNPLGLDDTNEPLVIVSFTVNWNERCNDDFVKMTTRHTIEQIDACATRSNTEHRYRYLNYCAEWQRPFESYGEENLRFLQKMSKKYDPDGLFQRGCAGGFKLGLSDIHP